MSGDAIAGWLGEGWWEFGLYFICRGSIYLQEAGAIPYDHGAYKLDKDGD